MSMYFDSQSDWQPGPGSAPPTSMSFSTPGTQMPSLHGINSRFPVNLGKIQHHPTYGAAPPPLSHLPHHNGFSYPGQHAPQSPFSTINGVSHHSQPHSQIFPQPHSQNLTHNPPIPIGSQSHHHQPPLPPPSAPPNDPRNGQGTAMTNGSLPPPSSSSASSSPHRQQQVQWRGIAANASAPFYHCRTAQHLARGGSATVTILDPNRPLKPTQGGPVAFRQSLQHRKEGSVSVPFTGAIGTEPPLSMTRSKGANMSPPRTSDGNNEEGEEEWTTLDMGGNKIKQLSPALFRYTFLTTLYLCHNNLTTLPSSIRELCNLTVLDISFNSITALPAELGMITSLRYLFVYDNQLTSLPAELGTLFQLDHLGIEGNHLPDNVMSLLDKDGTPGLIAYLRDSCAVPMPPPERLWFTTSNDTFALPQHAGDMDALNKSGQGDLFSILSYNILCEKMATTQMYGYTPSWALNWEYRKELILQEIITYSADIVCLQEVESAQYEEYFLPHLKQEYDGVYRQKSRVRHMTDKEKKRLDGSAIFFKSKNFRLIEGHLVEFNQVGRRGQRSEDMINRVMTKDDIAVIALLEHRTSGAKLIVSTFHLQWDPDFRDVKLIQTARLLEEIETLADRFARMPSSSEDAPTYSDGSKIPTILAGDFNSVADSGVFEFLKKGKVDPDHPDFLQKRYGHYTTDGLSHNLSLETAYGDHTHNIEFTNYTPGFKGVLDYIWYTTKTLTVTGLLQGLDPSYTSRVVGFPNAHFPSDHVSILSQMSFK